MGKQCSELLTKSFRIDVASQPELGVVYQVLRVSLRCGISVSIKRLDDTKKLQQTDAETFPTTA